MDMHSRFISVLAAGLAAAGVVAGSPQLSVAAKASGQLAFVQAVPGTVLTVSVDGREIETDVVGGTVVGPIDVPAGKREVVFADEAGTIARVTVSVRAGATSDVVVHRPAEVGGDPLVTVYPTPDDPIGRGKARVLLAHTATTAPADVEVDGVVVFTNIANGEYAEADVPAGSHQVSLLPSGVEGGDPILGPIDVDLKAGTLTAVYAVGNPRNRSMNVIVRETVLREDGSTSLQGLDTGSAGLVADVHVRTFRAD
jgi:Domain of unknown function (DUF4397)